MGHPLCMPKSREMLTTGRPEVERGGDFYKISCFSQWHFPAPEAVQGLKHEERKK
jgi:hypothetical protein